MSNRVCPQCGQEYSDTYRKCPFCEEAEAEKKGKTLRRRGGKRLSKRKRSAGAGGVMLLVMAVVIIGVMGYVFFGEQIASFMGIRTEQEQIDSLGGEDDGAVLPVSDDEDEQDTDVESNDGTGEETVGTGGPLALDYNAISIPAGETAKLTATGGTGTITWSTSNENIATVENGSVTGKAGGTATITAAAGEETVSCIVTVTGEPWVSDANLSLNKTDFTFGSLSEPAVQMKVSGTSSTPVWSIGNTSVATITEGGLVKPVGRGTTTITCKVDGQTLECIVRCTF